MTLRSLIALVTLLASVATAQPQLVPVPTDLDEKKWVHMSREELVKEDQRLRDTLPSPGSRWSTFLVGVTVLTVGAGTVVGALATFPRGRAGNGGIGNGMLVVGGALVALIGGLLSGLGLQKEWDDERYHHKTVEKMERLGERIEAIDRTPAPVPPSVSAPSDSLQLAGF